VITYEVDGFEETRAFSASIRGGAWVPLGGKRLETSAVVVTYTRSINGSWCVDSIRTLNRGPSVTFYWPDSSLPAWLCELVENFWPRPKGMPAYTSNSLSGELVSSWE
jgi:hypothetical protein